MFSRTRDDLLHFIYVNNIAIFRSFVNKNFAFVNFILKFQKNANKSLQSSKNLLYCKIQRLRKWEERKENIKKQTTLIMQN